jgi:hypothetical protein
MHSTEEASDRLQEAGVCVYACPGVVVGAAADNSLSPTAVNSRIATTCVK